jgi:NAD-specific glutamate dehydrogenase
VLHGAVLVDVPGHAERRELLVVTKSNRRATVHRTAHMDAIGVRRFGPTGEVVGIGLFLVVVLLFGGVDVLDKNLFEIPMLSGGIWKFNPLTNLYTDINGNLSITQIDSAATNPT